MGSSNNLTNCYTRQFLFVKLILIHHTVMNMMLCIHITHGVFSGIIFPPVKNDFERGSDNKH
jgi:hypothetical protein